MAYDEALVAGKLRRWEKYLLRFRLPEWEQIPDIGLYMEQVVTLLEQYLDYFPPELKEEPIITGSAINNYVRRGFLPEPKKKRYYRRHIACLIIICTLKQSLVMPMIRRTLPLGDDEDEMRRVYEHFLRRHSIVTGYFAHEVMLGSSAILGHEERTEIAVDTTEELIASAAIISGFSRLLAEKLLLLDGKTLEDGGSIEIE